MQTKEVSESSSHESGLRLWSDEPSAVDLLAFGAVAETVVEAALDDELDPLAVGVSGAWGSGKTTVLRLVEASLSVRSVTEGQTAVLTLLTDPWRYDPAVGAKQSLIGEVLSCLDREIVARAGETAPARKSLRRLMGRVDWAKALQIAARTSLTLQLPSVEALSGLIHGEPSEGEGDEAQRTLESFRDEFAVLMGVDELKHVKRLVVLVDDLDRCLPGTVVETLETIRLFLAVPKMAFVIAADEDRVADAIRQHYGSNDHPPEPAAGQGRVEEPARLYLHKIVQTTIPVPALSRFDTEAYLLLLQLLAKLEHAQLAEFVTQCEQLRVRSGDLDELPGLGHVDISAELTFAARLTPLLYEKLQGNPRRIKRFLNDLHVRQSVAERRGIRLEPPTIAKLMVLEVLLPEGFKEVLDWLARNELRDKVHALEAAAGRPQTEPALQPLGARDGPDQSDDAPDFSDNLLRWAKLPPVLSVADLGPYLYLAAAFRGATLLDSGLPERLRDLAAHLVSSVRAEQKSVTDEDLSGLTAPDAEALVIHLGRVARDRPTEQRAAVIGLLRITRLHATTVDTAVALSAAIPPDEVEPATVLSFNPSDVATFKKALTTWAKSATSSHVKAALKKVLEGN